MSTCLFNLYGSEDGEDFDNNNDWSKVGTSSKLALEDIEIHMGISSKQPSKEEEDDDISLEGNDWFNDGASGKLDMQNIESSKKVECQLWACPWATSTCP